MSGEETPESFLDGRVTLWRGDCLDVLARLPDASVDSVVCDPPYHLTSIVKRFGAENAAEAKAGKTGAYKRASAGFMGKKWDGGDIAFRVDLWAQVLRVLNPGGHIVAFSGTRTYHRMACAIEDAGFEVRDQIGWAYGSGFPKSHDVSKGIDKAARREYVQAAIDLGVPLPGRSIDDWTKEDHAPGDKWWSEFKAALPPETWEAIERRACGVAASGQSAWFVNGVGDRTAAATDAAVQWEGWGTALKPAWEPIVLARKPLIGTVAQNVLKHGTGALNIDGCRIATDETITATRNYIAGGLEPGGMEKPGKKTFTRYEQSPQGRWPANIVHDGSEEVLAAFPESESTRGVVTSKPGAVSVNGAGLPSHSGLYGFDDSGSAARFFYSAKADATDRIGSKHPTVKPVDLMQWLVRLVTPKRVLSCPVCDTLRHGNRTEKTSSDTPVRVVSDGVQTEGQSAHGAVLQPAMCGGGEGPSAKTMRVVRDNIPASQGRSEEVLQSVVRSEVDGQEPANVKGFCDEQSGLSASLDAGSSSIAQPEWLHLRTSLGDAADNRQTAEADRSRASQKRNQGRQQARKSGIDGEGRPRQTQSTKAERPLLPPLSGHDQNQPSCPNCGHLLEWGPGVCLDPFAGTGTTAEAAWREGMRAVLIEREEEYQNDIRRRMKLCLAGPDEKRRESLKARGLVDDAGPLFGGSDSTRGGQTDLRSLRGRKIGPIGLKV